MRSWAKPIVVGAFALLASLLVVPPPASASTQPTGPDVSRWQHPGGAPIDWVKVRRAGHSFAIIKATEGAAYVNPYAAGDLKRARAAHLIVGAYAFARPASPLSTATSQAKHFVKTIGSTRSAGTLPPILDLEVSGGLPPAALIAWTRQFLVTVQALSGRTPIIYSYPSFWSTHMAGSRAFSHYPLWLASYSRTTPRPLAGWTGWSLWQYTSKGTVPGIQGAGSVDVSRFRGSAAQLNSLANGTATAPAPVRSLLHAALSRTSTPNRHSVVMTGGTSARYAGERVYRQGYYSGAWHTWATTVVSRTGTFRFVITPTKKASNTYRVLLPASKGHAAAASPTVRLRVT